MELGEGQDAISFKLKQIFALRSGDQITLNAKQVERKQRIVNSLSIAMTSIQVVMIIKHKSSQALLTRLRIKVEKWQMRLSSWPFTSRTTAQPLCCHNSEKVTQTLIYPYLGTYPHIRIIVLSGFKASSDQSRQSPFDAVSYLSTKMKLVYQKLQQIRVQCEPVKLLYHVFIILYRCVLH